MLTVVEALQKIMDAAVPQGTHILSIEKALSHVLVDDVLADRPCHPSIE